MRASLLLGATALALLAAAPEGRAAEPHGHTMPARATALAERPPASVPIPAASASPAADGFHMPPLANFSEVLKRPLFAPDRRAHQAAEPAAAGPRSFALRGIVAEAGTQYALVEEGSTSRRVTEGQALGGGTVKEIKRDELVLDINGVETAVKLFDPKTNGKSTPGLSKAGGIPSQVPPGFPPGSAMPAH